MCQGDLQPQKARRQDNDLYYLVEVWLLLFKFINTKINNCIFFY